MLFAVCSIQKRFLNFGAVGAAPVTLITWYKNGPMVARQKNNSVERARLNRNEWGVRDRGKTITGSNVFI